MPTLPPPSRYVFDVTGADEGEDLVGVGADLAPGTVLEAYARGLFPMGLGAAGASPIGWWSPDPRGILRPRDLHVSRSLRRSLRHFEIRVDTDFAGVVAGCADPSRSGRWITPEIVEAYTELHRMGWAHSVEVRQDGRLVGGLYGIAIGGLFAGESMFHRRPTRPRRPSPGWSTSWPPTATRDAWSTCSGARRTWRRWVSRRCRGPRTCGCWPMP